MDEIFRKLLNRQEGDPTLRQALGTIGQDIHRNILGAIRGTDVFDQPIETRRHGPIFDSKSLQQLFEEVQNEIPVAETHQPRIPQEIWESQPALQSTQPQAQPEVLGMGSSSHSPIRDYALSYPGSRYTPEILDLLQEVLEAEIMARAIAASVAESGMGKAASNFKGDGGLKDRNWFGLHVGGDRTYDPESWEVMAQDLLRNFGPGSRFENITPESANLYTGGDRTSSWMDNFSAAMRAMGY
jgi:hypothetical protein